MKKIVFSDKQEQNLLVFGAAFVVLFMVYSVFLNHSFTSDHVNIYMNGDSGIAERPPLNPLFYIKTALGITVIPMWINYFMEILGITKETHQDIIQIFTIILVAYTVRLLYSFYSPFFEKKGKKVLLVVMLLLGFINPYFCEVFVYVGYDKIFGVIAAVIASMFFSKKRYILSFTFVLLAVTGYPIYYVLFLVYTTVWIYLQSDGEPKKETLGHIFKMYLVMLVPAFLLLFSFLALKFWGIGAYAGKYIALDSNIMERINCIKLRYNALMVTQQGLLPRYFTAWCFAGGLIGGLLVIKQKKVKNILWFVFLVLSLNLYPMTLYFAATNAAFSGRVIWCIFSALSGVGIIVLYNVEVWKNTGKIFVMCIAIVFCIDLYSVSSTITNFYISNALDKQIVSQIVAQIENYEKNTGVSVQKIAASANLNSKYSYPQVGFLGMDYSNEDAGYNNFTHKAMKDFWSDAELFVYLTKRPYTIVEMDATVWEDHFAGRSWETFNPQEQLYFEGDTIYWCIY